jgi:MFS family permease
VSETLNPNPYVPAAAAATDFFPVIRVMVVGLFLWSAATALTGIPCIAAGSSTAATAAAAASWVLPMLLVARGLMGLASAAAMPCVTATSAQMVPAAERASAVAGAYSAFNIGTGVCHT